MTRRRVLAALVAAFGLALLTVCGAALLGGDDGGAAAVDWATVSPEEVERLIVAGELDAEGAINGELFPLAVLAGNYGDPDVADVLARHGADINRNVRSASSALDFAVYRGDVEMATRLLELGADVARKGRDEDPIIFIALVIGERNWRIGAETRRKMIDLLLAHGTDINDPIYREKGGAVAIFTPLMDVLAYMQVGSERHDWQMRFLVERGADINARPSGGGLTAMILSRIKKACETEEHDICRELKGMA